MTTTDIRPHRSPAPEATAESANVAALRAALEDEAQCADWPEIRAAIDYLTATSVLAA